MFRYLFRRLRRSPWMALGVCLFASILSAALCGLNASNISQQKNYEYLYQTLPVSLNVTNLYGSTTANLSIYPWFGGIFTGDDYMTPNFSKYVKDVYLSSSVEITESELTYLRGITSLEGHRLRQLNGTFVVHFLPGYDESIFSGSDWVAIAPASLYPNLTEPITVTVTTYYKDRVDLMSGAHTFPETFQIVGTYEGSSTELICPYQCMIDVCLDLSITHKLNAVGATVADNNQLDTIRRIAERWFAEPDPLGTPVHWGRFGYETYPYALDINDAALKQASVTLRNSLAINRACTALVFLLSAASGFLIGFLVIRQQKREILLLRTMGTRTSSIFLGYAVENLLYGALGALLGGAVWLWQPPERLGVFLGLFACGLGFSLLIFLRRNLLGNLKEEE